MPRGAFHWSIAKRSLRSGEVNDKAKTCLKIALSRLTDPQAQSLYISVKNRDATWE